MDNDIVYSITLIVTLILSIFLIIIPMWKIFEKAGEPGWKSIIPIYNVIVLLQISGNSPWLILCNLIPYIGSLIVSGVTSFGLANKFGRGTAFGFGLFLLPFIFYPILGFGNSKYETEEDWLASVTGN